MKLMKIHAFTQLLHFNALPQCWVLLAGSLGISSAASRVPGIACRRWWIVDGSLVELECWCKKGSRPRIVSRSDKGPADALNEAFRSARGILIGWLNADDISPPGALARAVAALADNPEWLMVYGEGEEFNEETGLVQRYPPLPA